VLGYDVVPGGGRLVVNPEEAERVRAIFAHFEQQGSIPATLAEIQRQGWRLKSWTRESGQFREGGTFGERSLRRLLNNVIYKGAVPHKGQLYPGEHQAIVDDSVWERAQRRVKEMVPIARGGLRNKHWALLSGLLYCTSCQARMVYSYATKQGRKYPYYVCLNAQRKGWAACPSKSLPATAIEASVIGQIRQSRPEFYGEREWREMERSRQVEVIGASVARIDFDGVTRRITIQFRGDKKQARKERP